MREAPETAAAGPIRAREGLGLVLPARCVPSVSPAAHLGGLLGMRHEVRAETTVQLGPLHPHLGSKRPAGQEGNGTQELGLPGAGARVATGEGQMLPL